MLKRIFIFVTLLLSLSLVVFPKGLQAEGTEPPQSDLSVEVYDQLVIEDLDVRILFFIFDDIAFEEECRPIVRDILQW